ncbi:hypothetical protein SJAV_00220 [Sulfurisphaera javensis]|uniref:PIN domain-containing protein n=1 Tax=Sulfurisphaera javensis TaxID=2049879 RepID=A0AAT9GMM8_9CREN
MHNLIRFLRGIAYLGKDVEEFKEDIEDYFNVICLDNDSIKLSSKIYASLREKGELIDDPDLLIGSICISNNLTLITNNLSHFERLKTYGLKIVKADEII